MRVLLIAPETSGKEGPRHLVTTNVYGLNVTPEIRTITGMHRVTVLNGIVTAQDVYAACRGETRDVIHFATHSDEEHVLLSDGETLDAEDVAQIARMAHCRVLFFNSCRSAKLAAFAVGHGVPYAIATTVDLPDKDAWKTALSFYEYLREQMLQVHDPALVDIPLAFRQAVNGDGTYMLLTSIRRISEIADFLAEFQRVQAQQDADTQAWRKAQRRMTRYLAWQAAVMWLVLITMALLIALHVAWGG